MTDIVTSTTQAEFSPSAVIERLRRGNKRFSSGRTTERDHLSAARSTAGGQYPLAAVLGCIDSRVPIELVFDAGIGDLFAARSAGNVVDDDVLGGLEFAVELAGAKAIVVLGHTACGAVKGAFDGAELGHLTQLLAKIAPAVEAVTHGSERSNSTETETLRGVIEQNVRNSVAHLIERSDLLQSRKQAGELAVVGAVYDVSDGRIDWLEDE